MCPAARTRAPTPANGQRLACWWRGRRRVRGGRRCEPGQHPLRARAARTAIARHGAGRQKQWTEGRWSHHAPPPLQRPEQRRRQRREARPDPARCGPCQSASSAAGPRRDRSSEAARAAPRHCSPYSLAQRPSARMRSARAAPRAPQRPTGMEAGARGTAEQAAAAASVEGSEAAATQAEAKARKERRRRGRTSPPWQQTDPCRLGATF